MVLNTVVIDVKGTDPHINGGSGFLLFKGEMAVVVLQSVGDKSCRAYR
ncbi:hypothetical protein ACE1TI_08395 [Alteribacillus sp. JSM 102045]